MVVRAHHLNPKYINVKGEDKLEIIIIKIDIKVGTEQTVVIGECHIEVQLSMDKSTEEGCSMMQIIEVILGKEILEEYKIREVRILEMDIEITLGMIILEEVEVGIERDVIQVILGEMIEAAEDWDQDQEQVPIEIESVALSVGGWSVYQRLSKYIRYRKRAVRPDTADV